MTLRREVLPLEYRMLAGRSRPVTLWDQVYSTFPWYRKLFNANPPRWWPWEHLSF